ncbi:MAG: polyamine aminopropyltransferase [Rhodospirillales bacterium]|nr:polyamine aminopropyltransferase [Rhodospirillales bacterium]
MNEARWVEEKLHGATVSQRLRADRVLLDRKSGFQELLVIENPIFGRTLLLDGVVQTTERDEFIYHEMLAHVPLFAHGSARRVLIIGGGDGGTLEEVLKHPNVEQATLVEIDETVIAASREHLPEIAKGAFDDPRARVVIEDGLSFVRATGDRFDVVIIDSTDPQGPGWRLFTTAFYTHCRSRLNPGGILVAQCGVPFMQPNELSSVACRLRQVFREVSAYRAAVPSYYGGDMAFVFATDDAAKRRTPLDVLERRFETSGVTTRYYLPEVHLAAFALPRFIRDLMASRPQPATAESGGF